MLYLKSTLCGENVESLESGNVTGDKLCAAVLFLLCILKSLRRVFEAISSVFMVGNVGNSFYNVRFKLHINKSTNL